MYLQKTFETWSFKWSEGLTYILIEPTKAPRKATIRIIRLAFHTKIDSIKLKLCWKCQAHMNGRSNSEFDGDRDIEKYIYGLWVWCNLYCRGAPISWKSKDGKKFRYNQQSTNAEYYARLKTTRNQYVSATYWSQCD